MKRPGIIVLPILFLSILLGCSREDAVSIPDVSPKMLLPQLGGLGFKLQEANEIDHSALFNLAKDVASQFGIPVSQRDLDKIDFPRRMAIGKYRDEAGTITIKISQFEDGTTAYKELKSHLDKVKELERLLRRSKSVIGGKPERIRVNGQKAYWLEYLMRPSNVGLRYEFRLIWANGPYLFEVNSYGEEPRMIAEAVEIAGEIGL